MTDEMAEQIALMAAPIYAGLLVNYMTAKGDRITPEGMKHLLETAITQAHALWLAVIETKIP